jgi:formate dehydrogenase iron-sulfur subunit
VQLLKFLWLSRSEGFELRASSLLLSGRLQNLFVTRLAVLTVAGVLLPLMSTRGWIIAVAFAAVLASEWLGRHLFFVSVVPKNIAAAFTSGERRAA